MHVRINQPIIRAWATNFSVVVILSFLPKKKNQFDSASHPFMKERFVFLFLLCNDVTMFAEWLTVCDDDKNMDSVNIAKSVHS